MVSQNSLNGNTNSNCQMVKKIENIRIYFVNQAILVHNMNVTLFCKHVYIEKFILKIIIVRQKRDFLFCVNIFNIINIDDRITYNIIDIWAKLLMVGRGGVLYIHLRSYLQYLDRLV